MDLTRRQALKASIGAAIGSFSGLLLGTKIVLRDWVPAVARHPYRPKTAVQLEADVARWLQRAREREEDYVEIERMLGKPYQYSGSPASMYREFALATLLALGMSWDAACERAYDGCLWVERDRRQNDELMRRISLRTLRAPA